MIRAYPRFPSLFPGETLVLMVLALNAVADGIARRVDPRGATRRLLQTAP